MSAGWSFSDQIKHACVLHNCSMLYCSAKHPDLAHPMVITRIAELSQSQISFCPVGLHASPLLFFLASIAGHSYFFLLSFSMQCFLPTPRGPRKLIFDPNKRNIYLIKIKKNLRELGHIQLVQMVSWSRGV